MEKFYTIEEVSEFTRFAKQTIYNKISKKEFTLGIHYIKPSRKKILFREEGIQFLLGSSIIQDAPKDQPKPSENISINPEPKSLSSTQPINKSHDEIVSKSAINI